MATTEFTGPRLCGHCGVIVTMTVASKYGTSEPTIASAWGDDVVKEDGVEYRILICANCKRASLEQANWESLPDTGQYDEQTQTLYPFNAAAPVGLPADLVRIFEGTLKVKNVDPDSYVTKVRKLLEAVCQRHGATGRNLSDQIDSLADSGKIPPSLAAVAHNLRLLGNHGAHAANDEVPAEAVPVVEKLCAALLGYLYSMPLLVTQAENLLKTLDASRDKKPGATP